jgi:RNA polymerase sigma-70 factor (ECF subfamily)
VTPLPEPPAPDTLRAQLREVYRDRAGDLFAFAYRLTGSARAAEDVVHESVLRILDGRCRVNAARGQLALLLFGVVRNVAREQRRQAAREVGSEPSLQAGVSGQPEQVLAVRSALEALSATDREVIILSAYHGCSPREIATALGSTSLVIRVRLHRARVRLRRLLEGRDASAASVARLGVRP